ncbi:unnamed protein product, partial [marine sediment metagenome]
MPGISLPADEIGRNKNAENIMRRKNSIKGLFLLRRTTIDDRRIATIATIVTVNVRVGLKSAGSIVTDTQSLAPLPSESLTLIEIACGTFTPFFSTSESVDVVND